MSLLASAPLGVFDSGVGGLTVLKSLVEKLPHENFIYLGDTARVPYGSKPLEMVRAFANEISLELISRGVKGIVIACNTASAASLPALADELPVPVWGVVEPGINAATQVSQGRVGILATPGTLKSRAYQDRLERSGLEVWAKACPLFVPIVEEGISDGEIAKLVAKHYLSERPTLDTVILGCTHYPALKPLLQQVLGESVTLVDSAEETAKVVWNDLIDLGLLNHQRKEGTVHHLVSGDPTSYQHTARILGGPEGTLERIHFAERAIGDSKLKIKD
ncbi:MAG: glutamate racemase [Trueperaceae bacterium]